MVKDACRRIADFFDSYDSVSLTKGELILRADEEINYVFYLRSGYVRLYAMNEDGNELTLNIFKPGSYFPMTWAIGGRANNYYYEAMTGVEVGRAPKEELLRFIKGDNEILYTLTDRIVRGLSGLTERMEQLFFGSAKSRVASSLIMSAKRFGEKNKKKEVVIGLPLSHQDVAGLAGLTRETTSLVMKELQKKGLISYRRREVMILDMERLQRIVGER